jgi:hypothetical protein
MHPTPLLYLGCNHILQMAGQNLMVQCTWTIVILTERFLFLACIKDYQSSITALNTKEGFSLSPQTYIEHVTMKATTPPDPLYIELKDKDPNSAVQFGTMLGCKREE